MSDDPKRSKMVAADVPPLVIHYRNHRGVVAPRRIIPLVGGLRYGTAPPWHRESQWLLDAWDVDKGAARTFAFSGILHHGQGAPGPGDTP